MTHHLRLFAILAALAIAAAMPLWAQDSAHQKDLLRVHLDGFRSNNGRAHCTLFNDTDPAAFPEDGKKAFKEGEALSISNAYAEVDFAGIAPGKYALVCYHDENSNGKFDESMLGMPEEGYCFSNNVRPTLSAPDFSQCAFDYKGGDQPILMTMIYEARCGPASRELGPRSEATPHPPRVGRAGSPREWS